jgi:molybdate transport system ATP-binding protein
MSFELRLRRRLGATTIAADLSLAGGLSVLFGPSGSGKTSLLNMTAGLLRPDSGRVAIHGTAMFDSAAGTALPPEKRRIGYVFQDGRLFAHRRVLANLLYGYRLAPAKERWLDPHEAIALLGIGHLLDRWPASLSGGEAQRVAIGRALLAGSRALLMDEPLASLDRARREEVMGAVLRVRDELAIPILYVTHDRAEAERLATTIVEVQGDAAGAFVWRT